MQENAAAFLAGVVLLMNIVGAHLHAWTPLAGLIMRKTDVIGMKQMMNQVVPCMATLVEIWEVRMIIAAIALKLDLLLMIPPPTLPPWL
jgi:ABC-type microcin C transport system permease subunit YejB